MSEYEKTILYIELESCRLFGFVSHNTVRLISDVLINNNKSKLNDKLDKQIIDNLKKEINLMFNQAIRITRN